MTETPEARLKRMRMRSWRRGIKEMDLILGAFADTELERLAPETLDRYDSLLSENDQDLFAWVTGKTPPPEAFAPLIQRIAAHASGSASAN